MEGTNDILRIPPNNLEAEQSVLGAMILDKDALIAAIEHLSGEDFYKEANKEIFESILSLYNKNEPVDLITLSEELAKRDILEAVGGLTYLANLADGVSTTANIDVYCKIVEEKSILRRLIKASNEIIAEGYKDELEIQSIIDQAEKKIFEITQRNSTEGFIPMNKALMDALDQLEEMAQNGGGITGLPTGFIDLDRKISGLQRSALILVAARPAMGKSTFAMNIAQNCALKYGASVAVFNLEMSAGQIVQRMLSSESHVELSKILTGNLNDEEWSKIGRAMAPLGGAKIFLDDTPGVTLNDMRAKCRKLKIEKGLDLVVIDYLQLMSGDGRTENRQQEISKISRGLKVLAKELDIPIIALSQLSRAPELRSDHRPILSDLRESGAIEQDADVVMMLYRDDYYNQDSEKKGIGEVIITKQRNGPTGTVDLVFSGEYTKFLNKEHEH